MTAPTTTPQLPPPDQLAAAQTAAITATYLAATGSLRGRLVGALTSGFYAAGTNFGDSAADMFAGAAVPIVAAAQQTMSMMTAAYLAHLIATAGGGTRAPVGVPAEVVTGAALRAGVGPAVVYRRPYQTVWRELSQGKPLPDAVAAGQRRLNALASTDLQLAKTHTAREVLAHDSRVIGYRRVLTGPASCALCVIASTQRYHTHQLMPIHPGCDCAIAPVVRHEDTGLVMNNEMLNHLHEVIGRDLGQKYVSRGGRNYRDIVVAHNHGEIGPVLRVRGQDFTGPADIKNAQR